MGKADDVQTKITSNNKLATWVDPRDASWVSCKKGGLVIFCPNNIQDELVHLAGKFFIPSAIRNEPLICGHGTEKVKHCPANQASNN
jgi:hypothetical protein